MNGEKLSMYIGNIDNEFIEEAENYERPVLEITKHRFDRELLKIICAAACFCILFVGISVFGLYFGKNSCNDSCKDSNEFINNETEGNEIGADKANSAQEDTEASDASALDRVCVIGNSSALYDISLFDIAFNECGRYDYQAYGIKDSLDEQIESASECVSQGYKYIVIDPVSPDGWDSFLKDITYNGVYVIFINNTISCDESLYQCWIGYSNDDVQNASFSEEVINIIDRLSKGEKVEKKNYID